MLNYCSRNRGGLHANDPEAGVRAILTLPAIAMAAVAEYARRASGQRPSSVDLHRRAARRK
jgi:hypothetical protein